MFRRHGRIRTTHSVDAKVKCLMNKQFSKLLFLFKNSLILTWRTRKKLFKQTKSFCLKKFLKKGHAHSIGTKLVVYGCPHAFLSFSNFCSFPTQLSCKIKEVGLNFSLLFFGRNLPRKSKNASNFLLLGTFLLVGGNRSQKI